MSGITGLWCRWCGQRVRLTGAQELPGAYRKAVHEATGREHGPDTHLAAPLSYEPPLWKAARELAAEFGGEFAISARFGFLRADWADPGKISDLTAGSADELRPRLAAAVMAVAR